MDAINHASYFHIDALALIMMALVGFIAISVAAFASRYLKGDRLYRPFFVRLGVMVAAVVILVSANHIVIFLAAWLLSNIFLIRLMVHKTSWEAARQSGFLAAQTLGLGTFCIGAALALLAISAGDVSIQSIVRAEHHPTTLSLALALLIIGAMTQSAIWPFHQWLISSLNAPTPVSAIMHAGLVNGGGFLLARFASLFAELPVLLGMIFALGLLTALVGTLWKLMQGSIKRMLACSTMAQMGFMVMQCGLGLFSAAIAHLCWHGMFKAYLFLASGSAAQVKRVDGREPVQLRDFLLALPLGALGALAFAFASGLNSLAADTTMVLLLVAFIAGTQLAMQILRTTLAGRLVLAPVLTLFAGTLYGLSVASVEALLASPAFWQPQPLNFLHVLGMLALLGAWLAYSFAHHLWRAKTHPEWLLRAYVRMLNASQPQARTVTVHKNHYRYE